MLILFGSGVNLPLRKDFLIVLTILQASQVKKKATKKVKQKRASIEDRTAKGEKEMEDIKRGKDISVEEKVSKLFFFLIKKNPKKSIQHVNVLFVCRCRMMHCDRTMLTVIITCSP